MKDKYDNSDYIISNIDTKYRNPVKLNISVYDIWVIYFLILYVNNSKSMKLDNENINT